MGDDEALAIIMRFTQLLAQSESIVTGYPEHP